MAATKAGATKATSPGKAVFAQGSVIVMDEPTLSGGMLTVKVGKLSQPFPYTNGNRDNAILFSEHVAAALLGRASATTETATPREKTMSVLSKIAEQQKALEAATAEAAAPAVKKAAK